MRGRFETIAVLVILVASLWAAPAGAAEGEPAAPVSPSSAAPVASPAAEVPAAGQEIPSPGAPTAPAAPEAQAPPEASPPAPAAPEAQAPIEASPPEAAALPSGSGPAPAQAAAPEGQALPPAPPAASAPAEGQGQPPAAPSPEGFIYDVKAGDTLWDLSARYLKSPWKWPELWERNRFLTNPHYIYPGIRLVIVPPGPREYTVEVTEKAQAPAESAAEGPAAPAKVEEPAAAPVPAPLPAPAEPAPPATAGPAPRILNINPVDFVRCGEFLEDRPTGIGRIRDGRDPKILFSEGDHVYLKLDKDIPAGQMLGVYRVRGREGSSESRLSSGYVKFLVGILQVTGKEDGETGADVRESFEDLLRTDLITEEIPGYTPVTIDPGAEGLEAHVITGRSDNKDLSTRDFIFLDRGAEDGVATGNVFRLFRRTGENAPRGVGAGLNVRVEVARAVVVRVLPRSSTAYVQTSEISFLAGVSALRGEGGGR